MNLNNQRNPVITISMYPPLPPQPHKQLNKRNIRLQAPLMLAQQPHRLLAPPLSLQNSTPQHLHIRIIRIILRQILRRFQRAVCIACRVLRQRLHRGKVWVAFIVDIGERLLRLA